MNTEKRASGNSDLLDKVEERVIYLSNTASALALMIDCLAHESGQNPERFDECKAIAFVRRFPLYLATLSVIERDIEHLIEDLNSAVELQTGGIHK